MADNLSALSTSSTCRLCGGEVRQCLDFGRQPVSNAFLRPSELAKESFYRLAVGLCGSCSMVQQLEEVDRDRMFRTDYPFRSSSSSAMRVHFEKIATRLLETELAGPDAFMVEIGSNDGVTLKVVSDAGVRHLGVDPSRTAAELAAGKGIRTRFTFFEEASAIAIRAEDGPADVMFSANTISHIAYLDSIFRGVRALLAPGGVFVIEDRYLGDILSQTSFDQIYDEHFYLFTVRSVQAMVTRFGFELVDVEALSVHGGTLRYSVAFPGARHPTKAVREMLGKEADMGLADAASLHQFGARVDETRTQLLSVLRNLRSEGKRVVGYAATARSATVTNYCGIGPELLPYVCDTTPEKHGCVTPGSHIPVVPMEKFSSPYPDYALLFAWNHGTEIMAKEQEFAARGGRWIRYVPGVHIV
jgi:methylation protein EvaC